MPPLCGWPGCWPSAATWTGCARADADDGYAASRLAGLLAECGDLDGAAQILRARADAGDEIAVWQLADLLAGGSLGGLPARAGPTANRWDTNPAATAAVARSIYGHLPPGGTPLWLGVKNVGNADPAAALAALA